MRYTTALLLVAALAGAASAAVGDVYVFAPTAGMTLTATSSVIKAGYVTNVLTLRTDTDWLSAGMIVTPTTTNRIYNPRSGASPPFFSELYNCDDYPPAGEPINPNTWVDSFITSGSKLGGDPAYPDEMCWASASTEAGAVDLGGAATPTWTNHLINQVWYTTNTDEIGTFMIAQVTLKVDAQGIWKILIGNEGGDVIHPIDTYDPNWIDPEGGHQHMAIHSGVLTPEPATLALLALGGVAALIRRKR